MERAKILKLVVFLVFLMLPPTVFGVPPVPSGDYASRPLCQSQFILVSHACATIPFHHVPVPSPGSPLPPSPANQRRHELLYAPSPAARECCRWLNAVDDECICDILVRLPTFLSKPVHEYTITLTESCKVTFPCPSRLHI